MNSSPTIFVAIPAYRDPELLPTLDSLFAQATHPERISVGICWQYQPGVEKEEPKSPHPNLRWKCFPAGESRGPGWAKHQAQSLYNGEDFVLLIDSHMRFAPGWDKILLEQWKQCGSEKTIITHYPPGYTPPNTTDTMAKPTIVEACAPNAAGEIRLRGEPMASVPAKPVAGKFAAPGCLFAPGSLLGAVPADPHLYFEQEEICFSARLFTHGWEVFHPTAVFCYHLYETTAVTFPRRKHWLDNPNWAAINTSAKERRDHLLGRSVATSAEALHEIDRYSHGTARALKDFLPRATEAPSPAPAIAPAKRPSAYTNIPVGVFKPGTRDILQGLPQNARIAEAPPGVLIIENYASPELCQTLRDYADRTVGRKLDVVDHSRTTRDKVVTTTSGGRITDAVSINGMAGEILTIFNDIYAQRLAPFFNVAFEWYERPQILRYSAGGRYDPHADAEHWDAGSNQWFRSQDRDISVLFYLNEDYEGGEIGFDKLGFETKPKQGMLLAFLSDHRYLHAARPTLSGLRYTIVSWSAVVGTPRVLAQPPYASIHLHVA